MLSLTPGSVVLAVALVVTGVVPSPAAPEDGAEDAWWAAGSDAHFWLVLSDLHRPWMVEALRAAHMNTWYVDAKDELGRAGWDTPLAPPADVWPPGASPMALADAERDTPGVRPAIAARFSVFQDRASAEDVLPQARIGETNWLDPACAGVAEHLVAQLLDLVARHPVDEVNLDFVRYPAWEDVGVDADLPCTGGSVLDPPAGRDRHVTDGVAVIAAALHAYDPTIVVSGDVFGGTCERGLMEEIGQDVDALGPHLDVVMPMIYPGYFAPPAGFDPYGTVRGATEQCVERVGAAKTKPWVQGFNHLAYAYGNTGAVAVQIQAVRDGGGTGTAVWWFDSMGTHPAIWLPLREWMPEEWEDRPYRGGAD